MIQILPIQKHYNIPNKEQLSDYMIFTLNSWMDPEMEKQPTLDNLTKQLHQQQLSVCGGYLHASVLLVAATSQTVFPAVTDLTASAVYHPLGTHVAFCFVIMIPQPPPQYQP
jgi:hypothetical protein